MDMFCVFFVTLFAVVYLQIQLITAEFGSDCRDEYCTINEECHSTNKTCICDQDSYRNGMSCELIDDLKPSIAAQLPGINNIFVSWTAKNRSNFQTYYNVFWTQVGNDIVETLGNTSDFYFNVTGLIEGTTYNISIVRFLSSYGRSRGLPPVSTEITTKIDYNHSCDTNGTCFQPNTDCYDGRCRCNPRYYKAETCESIDDLKPHSVVLYSTGTKSMLVTWTSEENQVVNGFKVILKPDESLAHIMITNKSARITGLVPGRLYSVLVETKIEYLADRNEKTNGTMSNISRTRPAKTAGLAPSSQLNAPNIKITFHKAEGEFSGYIVRLQRTDPNAYNKTTELDNTTMIAEFLNVTAGLSYNLSIITVSGEMQSEQYITVFQVKAQQSGPVADLQAVIESSREMTITWKKPANPNGNIFQYLLEALNGTTCVQSVIFNCTDCNWENMTMDDSALQCDSTTNESVRNDELHEIYYTLTGLYPDTTYTIVVTAFNEVGRGASNELVYTTEEEAATKPKDFRSRSKTSNSIYLMWTPPLPRPGDTSYNITMYEQMETTVEYIVYKSIVTTGFYETSYNVTGLSSYWNYKFEIFAFTSKGASNKVESGVVTTDESAPTTVENLKFEQIDQVYDKIQLSWSCPAQKDGRNGVIMNATVIYFANILDTVRPPSQGRVVFPVTPFCAWTEILPVTAEFNYTFQVFVSNNYDGEYTNRAIFMPAGRRYLKGHTRSFDDPIRELLKLDSGPMTKSQVALDLCPVCFYRYDTGVIIKTGLLVCRVGNCPLNTTRFVLGEENCGLEDQARFCNGPLPVDHTYRVWIFACTRAGCAESKHVEFEVKVSDNSLPTTTIALIVSIIIIFVVGIVIAVIYIKFLRPRRMKRANERYTRDTSQKDDTYEEITGGHRLSAIQDGRQEVDYYNTLDSPPRSDNTYDQLAVYNNEGNHDYGQIKVTVT